MFPHGKFPGKLEVLKFPISRETYVEIPGNFLYFKGFNGTDIYHSDVKKRLCKLLIYFYLIKIIFQNFQNFLRPNAWEIKTFFLNLLKKLNSVRQNNIKKCLKLDSK